MEGVGDISGARLTWSGWRVFGACLSCILPSCVLGPPPTEPPLPATGPLSPYVSWGPGRGCGPLSSPTRPTHFTRDGDWPFLGCGGNTDGLRPAPEASPGRGVFPISNHNTIQSVWKPEPVNFNSLAIPVSGLQPNYLPSRGVNSAALAGALQDAPGKQLLW